MIAPGSVAAWKETAFTALIVSVLHGMIFWIVRRRQRHIRAQSVQEIKEVLADPVKNQLAVIGMWLPRGSDWHLYDIHLEGINESIDAIETMVDELSEETIHAWNAKYREAVANATDLGPAPPQARAARTMRRLQARRSSSIT